MWCKRCLKAYSQKVCLHILTEMAPPYCLAHGLLHKFPDFTDFLVIFGDSLARSETIFGQRSFLRGFEVRKLVRKCYFFGVFVNVWIFGHF